jgi:hypothetical protein
VSNGHDDPARQVVISEWDRWASKHLSTGYKTTRDDEMRFFSHMQEVCPQLLPAGSVDPWQTMHGWLLLERRVSPPGVAAAPCRPLGSPENEAR